MVKLFLKIEPRASCVPSEQQQRNHNDELEVNTLDDSGTNRPRDAIEHVRIWDAVVIGGDNCFVKRAPVRQG